MTLLGAGAAAWWRCAPRARGRLGLPAPGAGLRRARRGAAGDLRDAICSAPSRSSSRRTASPTSAPTRAAPRAASSTGCWRWCWPRPAPRRSSARRSASRSRVRRRSSSPSSRRSGSGSPRPSRRSRSGRARARLLPRGGAGCSSCGAASAFALLLRPSCGCCGSWAGRAAPTRAGAARLLLRRDRRACSSGWRSARAAARRAACCCAVGRRDRAGRPGPHRAGRRSRRRPEAAVAPYERAALEAALDRRPPGLRLLHRGLVHHLQAERAPRARHRAGAQELDAPRLRGLPRRLDPARRGHREELARLGRAGVPVYALYRPGGSTRRACCPTCSPSTASRPRCARPPRPRARSTRRAGKLPARCRDGAHTETRSAQRCADPLRQKGNDDDGSELARARLRALALLTVLAARGAAAAVQTGQRAPAVAGGPSRRPGSALARGAEGQGGVPRLLGVLVQAVRALAAGARRASARSSRPRTSRCSR